MYQRSKRTGKIQFGSIRPESVSNWPGSIRFCSSFSMIRLGSIRPYFLFSDSVRFDSDDFLRNWFGSIRVNSVFPFIEKISTVIKKTTFLLWDSMDNSECELSYEKRKWSPMESAQTHISITNWAQIDTQKARTMEDQYKNYVSRFLFSIDRRKIILFTVEGSKLERLWLTICPAALNWRPTAAELHGIEKYCFANRAKLGNARWYCGCFQKSSGSV